MYLVIVYEGASCCVVEHLMGANLTGVMKPYNGARVEAVFPFKTREAAYRIAKHYN